MNAASSTRSASPFDPRAVLGLLLFGAIAFIAALYFLGTGSPSSDGEDAGSHAASSGLNGYAALVQLLRKQGHPVAMVRNTGGLREHNLLILTPPHNADGKELARIIEQRRYAGPTIVILPKWLAYPASSLPGVKAKRGWVMLDSPTTPNWPGFHDDISIRLSPSAAPAGKPQWRGAGLSGRLPDGSNVLSASGPSLVPLVHGASDSSVLAAYVNDGGIYPELEDLAGIGAADLGDNENTYPLIFIFEPDLMNNYGMADRTRALLALRLVDAALDRPALEGAAISGQAMPLAFDLTLNGLGGTPNLLTLAFTPPFLAPTLCLIIAAIVVGWRGFLRFGDPRTETRQIAFGKRQLAVNGAALIQRSQRFHLLGAPYAALLRARLARALGLKPGTDIAQTDADIDRLLAARGIPGFLADADALARAKSPQELLRRAHAMRQIERKLEK